MRKITKKTRLMTACGITLGILLVLMLGSTVLAVPQPPNQFYGTVTVNGLPAPEGTEVSVEIEGVQYDGCVTYVDANGRYGYGPLLMLPSDDLQTSEKEGGVKGDSLAFYVDGVLAAEAVHTPFHVTRLDLVVSQDVTGSFSSTDGGSVVSPGEGDYGYQAGDEISLVAQAEDGYAFTGWTGDVATVADVNAAETTMVVTGNFSITATFAVAEYELSVSSTNGGSVVQPGEGVYTYASGTVVTLEAVAEDGYVFAGWIGTVADSDATVTTITVTADSQVEAVFTAEGGELPSLDDYNMIAIMLTPKSENIADVLAGLTECGLTECQDGYQTCYMFIPGNAENPEGQWVEVVIPCN